MGDAAGIGPEVIAKALTPDPDKRYHTPTELMAAFDGVVARRA